MLLSLTLLCFSLHPSFRYQDKVPSEQYFSTDYAELYEDENGWPIDAGSQLPLNQAPIGPYVKIDGSPYDVQPFSYKALPKPLRMEQVVARWQEQYDWYTSHARVMHRTFLEMKKAKHRVNTSDGMSRNRQMSKHLTIWGTEATSAARAKITRQQQEEMSRRKNKSGGSNVHSLSSTWPRTSSAPGAITYFDDDGLDNVDLVDMITESEDSDYAALNSGVRSRRQRRVSTRQSTAAGGGRRLGGRVSARSQRRARRRVTRLLATSDDDFDDDEEDGDGVDGGGWDGVSEDNDDDGVDADSSDDQGSSGSEGIVRGRASRKRNSVEGYADDEDEPRAHKRSSRRGAAQQGNKKRTRKQQQQVKPSRRGRKHADPEGEDELVEYSAPKMPHVSKRTIPLHVDVDREWLMMDTTCDQEYCPQVGDHVLYFPQGHMEHLNLFPEPRRPPWMLFAHRWPVVECRVEKLDFNFPSPMELKKSNSIVVTMTLRLLGRPVRWGNASPGHMYTNFAPPRESRHSQNTDIIFQVMLRNTSAPDFIVPWHVYHRAAAVSWSTGQHFLSYFKELDPVSGEMELKVYPGTVMKVSDRERHDWPQSPWESLQISWNNDTDDASMSRISPWDAEVVYEASEPRPLALPAAQGTCLPDSLIRAVVKEINACMEDDQLDPFAYPVDSQVFADYYCVVQVPVYLDLIRRRLESKFYRQVCIFGATFLYYRTCICAWGMIHS